MKKTVKVIRISYANIYVVQLKTLRIKVFYFFVTNLWRLA